MRTIPLLLFVLPLALAGCGGGGGSNTRPDAMPDAQPSEHEPDGDTDGDTGGGGDGNVRPDSPPKMEPQPKPDDDEQHTDEDDEQEREPEQPPPPPPPPPPSVRDTLSRLIASSNTVTDASTINGSTFLWNVTVQPTPATLMVDDITGYDVELFQSLGVRRGVARGTYRWGETAVFGGWMTHSFFLGNVWNPVSGDPLHPHESTFSHTYSIGSASGSNPTAGSATWTGVMAGIDERESRATLGNLVEGDATVTIGNFAQPAVDIHLTNITDANTGGRHGDISWSDISLSAGAFSTSTLSGQFYGPNHEEVGGVFLRNQINGAFGATR